jgi:hypothetical protein
MGLDKNLLKIYELFGKDSYKKYGDHQHYFASHTLDRLCLDFGNTKEAKEIRKIVKPFLSNYTIHPYLMLEQLSEDKSHEIVELIFNDISTNLFPDKKFDRDIIRRVEYPSLNMRFMKNLLNTITSERRDERFNDPKKARELFLLYADKQHLGLTLDELESYAQGYHRATEDGGGLDFDDE